LLDRHQKKNRDQNKRKKQGREEGREARKGGSKEILPDRAVGNLLM